MSRIVTLLTFILSTLGNQLLIRDLITASKSIFIDRVDRDSKVNETKSFNRTKYFYGRNQKIAKSKIIIRPENYNFLFKSKNKKLQALRLNFLFPKLN